MKHVGTGAGARAVRQKMRLNPYYQVSLTIIHALAILLVFAL